jgi:uncharacterized membrane protein
MSEPNIPSVDPPPVSRGLPPKVAAAMAMLIPLAGGMVLLRSEKRNPFVRFYAMQSVLFGGVSLAAYVTVRVLTTIFDRVPLLGFILNIFLTLLFVCIGLIWVCCYLMAIFKALSGVEWEIPYIGPLARKQLAQG